MHKVIPIPAFHDNYIWAIIHPPSQQCLLVDPGDATPALAFLKKNQLKLKGILLTHHHHDHTGGVSDLVQTHPCDVYGPGTIALCTCPVGDGDIITFNDMSLQLTIMATPGHTLDHIAYHNNAILFCGDTLFSGGCGRLFEGTMDQLWHSLKRLAQLDDNIRVYCGHEYTQANLSFAKTIEPDNKAIHDRLEWSQKQSCTLPSTISIEKSTNVFLRCHLSPPQQWSKIKDEFQTFASIRAHKDHC
jgi:hydroxyacylglutathione hydrolase